MNTQTPANEERLFYNSGRTSFPAIVGGTDKGSLDQTDEPLVAAAYHPQATLLVPVTPKITRQNRALSLDAQRW